MGAPRGGGGSRGCRGVGSVGEGGGEGDDLLGAAEAGQVAAVADDLAAGVEVGEEVGAPSRCRERVGADHLVDDGGVLGVQAEFAGQPQRDGDGGLIAQDRVAVATVGPSIGPGRPPIRLATTSRERG